MMKYNLGEIRKLINSALGDDALQDLCFDHFHPVYEQFTPGQNKGARIRMLVKYADLQREIPKLLGVIENANLTVYTEFKARLVLMNSDPDQFTAVSSVDKLTNQKNELVIRDVSIVFQVQGEQNPFKTAGSLPEDALSYIQRACDRELEDKLRKNQLIAITGDYAIGKSSLLLRASRMLSNVGFKWKDCFMDFSGMRTDDFKISMNEFFDFFEEISEGAKSWQKLTQRIKQEPMIICIDEFGYILDHTSHDKINLAKELTLKLHWLTCQLAEELRLVVCLPNQIDTDSRKAIGRPLSRFLEDCKTISVEPFNIDEALQLMSLLPEHVRILANGHLNIIQQRSSFRPKALQALCYSLFDEASQGATQKDLIHIIHDEKFYR